MQSYLGTYKANVYLGHTKASFKDNGDDYGKISWTYNGTKLLFSVVLSSKMKQLVDSGFSMKLGVVRYRGNSNEFRAWKRSTGSLPPQYIVDPTPKGFKGVFEKGKQKSYPSYLGNDSNTEILCETIYPLTPGNLTNIDLTSFITKIALKSRIKYTSALHATWQQNGYYFKDFGFYILLNNHKWLETSELIRVQVTSEPNDLYEEPTVWSIIDKNTIQVH